jgi:hypothetical protein
MAALPSYRLFGWRGAAWIGKKHRKPLRVGGQHRSSFAQSRCGNRHTSRCRTIAWRSHARK